MTPDDPIFTSVGQALHVSYLMAILPPTQRVSTQVLIDSIREQIGRAQARAASTINLGGMSPLEFRGQCAMVTAAARDHLAPPEYAAVRARFGHRQTKAQGVRDLADYLAPALQTDNTMAALALTWANYHNGSQRAADRWSLRAIERETGVSMHTLRTCARLIRERGETLECRAEQRLGALFSRTGVTPAQ